MKVALMHCACPSKQTKQNLLCIVTACCITGIVVNTLAETAPITSSGLNTQISGPISVGGQVQYDITGGTRAGTNLFHSFGAFGVPNHTIANFHNDSGLATSNILGRVTGGHRSNIFGAIQTSGFDNANLFLMNPAGFLFGPNATLDIGGMASFTSADYLRLSHEGKDGYFYADPTRPSLLTSWPVTAFGFLGSNPKAITVQGSHLEVKPDKGIALVGGNITIESEAQLSSPNGQIQLAVAASPGEFDVTSLQSIPNVNKTSFTSFGSVTLKPDSMVNLSGADSVSIRGGQFVLNVNDAILSTTQSAGAPNLISLKPGSSIISSNASIGSGAEMKITTAALQMDQARVINRTTGPGDAGSVRIHAQDAIHTTDSFISTASDSTAKDAGSGGQIILQAPLVEMSGGVLSSVTQGSKNAGNITVQTSVLNLSASASTGEPAEINASTYGPGHGGTISIQGVTGPGSRASDVTLSGQSSLLSETLKSRGDAGSISVKTVQLTLREGSEITTASRGSSGNAGNITLNATESVLLSGSFVKSNVLEESKGHGGNISITTSNLTVNQNTDGRGGLISTSTTSSKNAGTITINADKVALTDGGRLSSNGALPEDPTLPPPGGAAGTILIQGVNGPGTRATSLVVRGQDGSGASSGISTDTRGTGAGGNITVNANHVQLHSGATITAESTGAANAGNINITATNGLTMQNSFITTKVDSKGNDTNASGGNITITTSPGATVYLQDSSEIRASVPGKGVGGNISIDPQFVVLQNSRILAQADQGRGGNITIITSVFQQDANSVVNADSRTGVNGTVTIQAPYAPAGGKIQPLGNQPLQATQLLNQRCAAMIGGQFSSFTVAGRNSLPIEPSGWLSSPLALTISGSHDDTMTSQGLRASQKPTGDPPLLSLRQIAPSGFLTKAFAVDRQAGCTS